MDKPTASLRLLLLSDTHGQIHPSILALAAGVDLVVHAGDVGCAAVLDALRGAGRSLLAVRGNNDLPATWPAQDQAELDALPSQASIDLPGGRLAVEHGHLVNPVSRRHARLRQRHADARLVVYGHSHRQLLDDSALPLVVNPGAAGRARTFGGSGCMLLHITPAEWKIESLRFSLD